MIDDATQNRFDLGDVHFAAEQGLQVVSAQFKGVEPFNWNLFDGYERIRVLTYSASAPIDPSVNYVIGGNRGSTLFDKRHKPHDNDGEIVTMKGPCPQEWLPYAVELGLCPRKALGKSPIVMMLAQ